MSNEPLRLSIENLFLQCRDFELFRKCLDNVLGSKGLDHNIDRERAERAEAKVKELEDILACCANKLNIKVMRNCHGEVESIFTEFKEASE